MRGNRINYFESPRPIHFNETNLLESRFHHSDDQEVQDERIFVTPLRLNTQLLTNLSPMRDPHLISSQPRVRLSQDFFCESGTHNQNQQQYLYSHHGINQKLQFSEEEDLLKPITPQKVQKLDEGQEPGTTIRRPHAYSMTPLSQGRSNERGLRRLASEAYRFVTQQKKTTYKEVAKRLIEQMGEDCEMDINRKGQMNIKRRVYDALNVLIALGVLKRNGNRILSKKVEHPGAILNESPQRQQQQMKEEQMEIELAYLREQYEKRFSIIEAKRKHLKEVRTKIEHLKALQDKNQSQHKQLPNQNKISFPMIAFCLKKDDNQSLLKKENQMGNQAKGGSDMKLWQEGQTDLYCSFNTKSNLDLMGELDLVLRWQRVKQNQPAAKSERGRRKKRC